MSNVVECPNSNDIVFRQGSSVLSHPGNMRFRSIIEATVVQLRENPKTIGIIETTSKATSEIDKYEDEARQSKTTKMLISELIDQVIETDKGRVLLWTKMDDNDKNFYECWCLITKKEQIFSKIEYIVRECIRECKKEIEVLGRTTKRTTTISEPQPQPQPRASVSASAVAEAVAVATASTNFVRAETERTNQQNIESSTSIVWNQSNLSSGSSPLPPSPQTPRDRSYKRAKKSPDSSPRHDDNRYS